MRHWTGSEARSLAAVVEREGLLAWSAPFHLADPEDGLGLCRAYLHSDGGVYYVSIEHGEVALVECHDTIEGSEWADLLIAALRRDG